MAREIPIFFFCRVGWNGNFALFYIFPKENEIEKRLELL
jgi:hypothetical protein